MKLGKFVNQFKNLVTTDKGHTVLCLHGNKAGEISGYFTDKVTDTEISMASGFISCDSASVEFNNRIIGLTNYSADNGNRKITPNEYIEFQD